MSQNRESYNGQAKFNAKKRSIRDLFKINIRWPVLVAAARVLILGPHKMPIIADVKLLFNDVINKLHPETK